jgi:hypothetical protein
VFLGREFLRYFYLNLDYDTEEVKLRVVKEGISLSKDELNTQYVIVYPAASAF